MYFLHATEMKLGHNIRQDKFFYNIRYTFKFNYAEVLNFTTTGSKFQRKVTKGMLFDFFILNPYSSNVPILYSLKISENCRLSVNFRGYRIGTLT